jgi:hypothetical protein
LKQKPDAFSVAAGVVFLLYGLAAAAAYSSCFSGIPLLGKFLNPLASYPLGQFGPVAIFCWVGFLVGLGLLLLYSELSD